MKLMLLFGDGAVGKMTVGQELMKITPLRLFHNHMTIEPVLDIFGKFDIETIFALRDVIFERFSQSDAYGMIFTFMWAFDSPADWAYVAHIKDIFKLPEEDIYYVELIAPLDVRLQRNVSENRLLHKSSKRDVQASNQRLVNDDTCHRFISHPGEIPFPNYFRLENTEIPAAEAAKRIKAHFRFPD